MTLHRVVYSRDDESREAFVNSLFVPAFLADLTTAGFTIIENEVI